MNTIVLDLEWNQGNATKESQDKTMPFEVIEIGAVKLDENLNPVGDYSRLIRPTCYKTMHFITGKLLHITMEDLKQEQMFPEVIKDFLLWCGEDPLFCTWGPLDLTELQRNMRWHGLPALSDGPLPFLDAQKLFGIAFRERHERLSLENAVDELKLEKTVPFHRAHDDAYYTACILKRIPKAVLKNISYDYFTIPKDRSSEVHIQFDTYTKYISRGFKNKESALNDDEVMSRRCYLCGTRLKKHTIGWFTPNGKQYYSVSHCPIHGYMKAKVRIRKAENEEVYVVKTERFADAEDVESLRLRKEKADKVERKKKNRHHSS